MDVSTLPGAETAGASLVARAQAGDSAAFSELYRLNRRRIYAVCARLLGDRQVAEELTQDTFIRAWQRLRGFRGEAQFSTWLHRIAVNVVISHQRKHRPWRRWLESEANAAPEPMYDSHASLRRDLEGAIAQLPLRARQVFVLMDVEGYSHEEAAGALGVAVGTTKAQLFRARQLLRDILQ